MPEKNKKTLWIILAVLVITILAVIVYLLFFFKWPGDSPLNVLVNNMKTVNKIVKEALPVDENIKEAKLAEKDTPAPTNEEIDRYTAVKIASSFAERFGSYSNQSDYGNITDLRSLMTKKMQAWADEYVADARKNNPYNGSYQGAIAKAVSSEVKSFDAAAGQAEIIISAQRSELSADSIEANVYYEDIIIKMIKEGGTWKIDSAFWQGKK
ncbi:MAG: hypothetical protein WC415_02780 [Patescibacteria group bacterium]|jgi:hypothetical protein